MATLLGASDYCPAQDATQTSDPRLPEVVIQGQRQAADELVTRQDDSSSPGGVARQERAGGGSQDPWPARPTPQLNTITAAMAENRKAVPMATGQSGL
jgi:hypothetical protein